jgi:succinyl-diaminopimelate desuccinylase
MDRRFLIEEDIMEVKAEVTDLLAELADSRPNFRYQIRDIMEFLPTMTDANAPVVLAVSASIREVLGKTAEHVISPGTYEQKHIARIGHLHDCIAYGPGILDLAHQPDEYIVIDDMVAAAKVMAASTLKLLGVTVES